MEGTQLQQTWVGVYCMLRTNSTPTLPSPVKPVDLMSLDKKIDDGIGNTGAVLSGAMGLNGGGPCSAIQVAPLATCSDSANGVYAIGNSNNTCTPLIRIGAQSGDPQ